MDLTEVKQCAGWGARGRAVALGTGVGTPLAARVAAAKLGGCLVIQSLD